MMLLGTDTAANGLTKESFQLLEVSTCVVTWRYFDFSAQILVENALYYTEDACAPHCDVTFQGRGRI